MSGGRKTIEQKLEEFAAELATDLGFADAFQKMSLEEKAQAMLEFGFTEAELGSIIANQAPAKTASLQAGVIWAL